MIKVRATRPVSVLKDNVYRSSFDTSFENDKRVTNILIDHFMKKIWLFKKLNLSLRIEVIINISFLMLAAILLIGFTISKINEREYHSGKDQIW